MEMTYTTQRPRALSWRKCKGLGEGGNVFHMCKKTVHEYLDGQRVGL